ncbi:Hypothetical protein PHPALM_37005 [Phytophthora palmivora]|uniref:Uncharacterized protein n=1 Tax=Phytophthora palmivora TaxID=4796 RepID=A0A2P4WYJ8_9STRA|nr:Hypothetical protein PHPALM_37005 [Phytophthora palmivora]
MGLAGYQSPDLPPPSIRELQQRLSVLEFGLLQTFRDELYHLTLGFRGGRFNVAVDVIDATFTSLLKHLEEYELERGIFATNSRLGCAITKLGFSIEITLANHKHAQLGLTIDVNSEKRINTTSSINDRLGKIEDTQTQLLARITNTETSSPCRAVSATAVVEGFLGTASTLAGSLFNRYTNHIWETGKGKKEQSKRVEVKATINIMIVLYQKLFTIPQELILGI